MNFALIELLELVRDFIINHYERRNRELNYKITDYEVAEEMRRELGEDPYNVDKYLEQLNDDDVCDVAKWLSDNGHAEEVLDGMDDEEICDYLERRNISYHDLRQVLRNNYNIEDFIEVEWRW